MTLLASFYCFVGMRLSSVMMKKFSCFVISVKFPVKIVGNNTRNKQASLGRSPFSNSPA